MLLLLLLLADKASVSHGVDAEGQDNASHRSEEEEETDEEGQEKEEEEEESGAVPGTGAVYRTGLAIGLCTELYQDVIC